MTAPGYTIASIGRDGTWLLFHEGPLRPTWDAAAEDRDFVQRYDKGRTYVVVRVVVEGETS